MIWVALWGLTVGLIRGFFAGLAFGVGDGMAAERPEAPQSFAFAGEGGPILSPTLTVEDAARLGCADLGTAPRLTIIRSEAMQPHRPVCKGSAT